jgi:lysophospholipase L1-like esterase
MFSLARQFLLIVGITGGCYWLVDTVFGHFFSPSPYAGSPERQTAVAYRNEPYFSERFLSESFTQPGHWDTIPGTRLVLPAKYQGQFFHTDQLGPTGLVYRRTMFAAVGRKPILILGGSTVYNSEVPDSLTLPSQLASLVNRVAPDSYSVLNAGVTSSNTSQELERLELELSRGLNPALVISFSGFNDVWQGIYYGNPDSVMFSHDQRKPFTEFMRNWAPLHIYRFFRAKAEADKQRNPPVHLMDKALLGKLEHRTRERYISNLLRMRDLLAARGIPFIAFLQPNATSGSCWEADKLRAEDVREFLEWVEVRQPMGVATLRSGHSSLRFAVPELARKGLRIVDLSETFCARQSPVFLDPVHVNGVGNALIAYAMLPHLVPLFP